MVLWGAIHAHPSSVECGGYIDVESLNFICIACFVCLDSFWFGCAQLSVPAAFQNLVSITRGFVGTGVIDQVTHR